MMYPDRAFLLYIITNSTFVDQITRSQVRINFIHKHISILHTFRLQIVANKLPFAAM